MPPKRLRGRQTEWIAEEISPFHPQASFFPFKKQPMSFLVPCSKQGPCIHTKISWYYGYTTLCLLILQGSRKSSNVAFRNVGSVPLKNHHVQPHRSVNVGFPVCSACWWSKIPPAKKVPCVFWCSHVPLVFFKRGNRKSPKNGGVLGQVQ